jgi:PilZ domain
MMKSQTKEAVYKPARQVLRYSYLRDLSVKYEGQSESISVHPPDISQRGMFINTSHRFPEGSVLQLRFHLAHTGVEISTRCEVRYCLAGIGVGVEFVDLPAESARAIEEEIRAAGYLPC